MTFDLTDIVTIKAVVVKYFAVHYALHYEICAFVIVWELSATFCKIFRFACIVPLLIPMYFQAQKFSISQLNVFQEYTYLELFKFVPSGGTLKLSGLLLSTVLALVRRAETAFSLHKSHVWVTLSLTESSRLSGTRPW